MNLRFALLAAAVVFASAQADDNSQPTLFVAPLEADLTQIQGWQPAVGEGLAEMLITEVTKLNKFQVLESTALQNLKDEIKLGDEGFVSGGEAVQKGGWAGADFMFRGKVTRFGAKSQGVNLGGFVPGSLGNLGLKRNKTDVRIDWRVVDVATRKVLKAGEAVADETGLGFNIGVGVDGKGGTVGFNNSEFMSSALGKATVKAIALVMADLRGMSVPTSGRRQARQKTEETQQQAASAAASAAATAALSVSGKVLAVPGKSVVIVSLGSRNGYKAGDKLKLYETIDTKGDKGEVVFTEEKLVGEITLDSVQDERSKATYSGDLTVKIGWTVKGI